MKVAASTTPDAARHWTRADTHNETMSSRNPGYAFDASLLRPSPRPNWVIEPGAPTRTELETVIRCMDFTTLGGDDTHSRVAEFLDRAKHPAGGIQPAAVCLFPVFISQAKAAVAGTSVKVATVAAAFPHGLSMLSTRVAEVEQARDLGADEIDIVIQRGKALGGEWNDLYREVRAFREAAGQAHLKVILETGELKVPDLIYAAAMASMLAGADFVKTSTGKTSINATLDAAGAMLNAIRVFKDQTGSTVGFKAAGGIRTAVDAVSYLRLASAAMGNDYAQPATFRIGASSLLDDVEKALA